MKTNRFFNLKTLFVCLSLAAFCASTHAQTAPRGIAKVGFSFSNLSGNAPGACIGAEYELWRHLSAAVSLDYNRAEQEPQVVFLGYQGFALEQQASANHIWSFKVEPRFYINPARRGFYVGGAARMVTYDYLRAYTNANGNFSLYEDTFNEFQVGPSAGVQVPIGKKISFEVGGAGFYSQDDGVMLLQANASVGYRF
jgi:hypothetical protein